jgi:hypothetical protein
VAEEVAGGGRLASAVRGRKVPPKYRSPSGETWAGRGVKPRWLVAAIKGGKGLNDFLIDKVARKGRKNANRSRAVKDVMTIEPFTSDRELLKFAKAFFRSLVGSFRKDTSICPTADTNCHDRCDLRQGSAHQPVAHYFQRAVERS